jgi:MerR family transcriptional regulator/heat shock protein HspR
VRRLDRDPTRPVYVISVAASIVSVHPRTLRIYEDEGLLCPARTATNIRLYSEEDVRRILWIRHLTQNRGVNLAGIRILFELEERLGTRILETLFDEANAIDDEQARQASKAEAARPQAARPEAPATAATPPPATEPETNAAAPRASRASTSNEPSQQTPNRTRQVVGADHH